ncbi:MAG: winged helix-turn-helix domain-containing protein [Novosphingobium sp.]|nr:winged helix-turn-helix domain-containing protein [Novosphingobium sp.]
MATLKIKIQLYCGDEIAMGPGKADLLDAITQHGSISKAGRSMGMSYRRAWMLVDTMNRCWGEPLVRTSPGNKHGGGATVTDFGKSIAAAYRQLQGTVQDAASCEARTFLSNAILSAPRAHKGD